MLNDDDKMKVELVAYTPNPQLLCDMASRTCTSKECPEMNVAVNKTKALQHAIESGHYSVVEHAVFTFQIEGISRACSHQLVRHRMASYSQQSQRYVDIEEFQMVIPETVDKAIENELMNGEGWNPNGCLESTFNFYLDTLDELVDRMRKLNIPEEDIRYFYPQGITTNITVTMNARELLHFFEERCCNRAQWEIRELANKMLELVKEVAPIIFDNAGAKCKRLGYCPEKKGCGMYE